MDFGAEVRKTLGAVQDALDKDDGVPATEIVFARRTTGTTLRMLTQHAEIYGPLSKATAGLLANNEASWHHLVFVADDDNDDDDIVGGVYDTHWVWRPAEHKWPVEYGIDAEDVLHGCDTNFLDEEFFESNISTRFTPLTKTTPRCKTSGPLSVALNSVLLAPLVLRAPPAPSKLKTIKI